MPEPNTSPDGGPPGAILIADDEENDLVLLKLALKNLRVLNPVQAVADSQSLLEYLKGEGQFQDRAAYPFPSLLLLDLHLPDRSGLEVLAWLKDNPPRTPLCVVVWTDSADQARAAEAYRLGAHHVFQKPMNQPGIRSAIQSIPGTRLEPAEEGFHLVCG